MAWLNSHEREHIFIQNAVNVAYLPAHAPRVLFGLEFLEERPFMPGYPYSTDPLR